MRSKPLVLSLIVIAVAGVGWWWTQTRANGVEGTASGASAPAAGASGSAKAVPPQLVGVWKAKTLDVPVSIEASGTVAALATVDLRAQTTSTVRERLIKDGEMVRKGQALFRFDDRADRANLEKARAQLARDRAQLADAERQLKRAEDLKAQGFVAQNAVDTALANVEAQRALVQSDEAAIQAAQVQLSYNELRAPFAGRAGMVNAVPGALVQANASATPLVSIAQLDPIGVSFVVPETQLNAVLAATRGSKAEGLEAQVIPAGGKAGKDADALKGRVSFVDNLVDPSTGTLKLRADFGNDKHLLWPGQYVRVKMVLRTLKDAVVVPQAAIIQRGNERSVYVVAEDKTAVQKTVQTRYPFGDLVVVEGLQAGEQVVLDGKQNLRPGTPLKTQQAALNPAAPVAAASGASK
ncbi:efflux RND transporter periplasmic adaptor subunit [Pelomonas sp. SE-A7]|uniref:efflux RND transporter periplasmic adaptor subunit n=1 Tax=Pelomonas sp. SE-A7 TaxID=3054953 RepID=UPI00259CA7C2|nr:efflux RND transporter periplasmic adaptor subunit [Pelomonas sp. SE-A7]MDM4766860.1 efflux RND transporter periplasmic adaptor subunit [Pelomonas sp. SE-A7]